MIVVPVVLIAAVAGLAVSGVINIPGISPKKKVNAAAALYSEKDKNPPVAKKTTPPPLKTEKPLPKPVVQVITKDPKKGEEALAAVWSEVKEPELAKITSTWKDDELAKVLSHMESDKVAKYLAYLAKGDPDTKVDPDPKRASVLSRKLQDLGAISTSASE